MQQVINRDSAVAQSGPAPSIHIRGHSSDLVRIQMSSELRGLQQWGEVSTKHLI